MRLDKYLSHLQVGSRSEVKKMIKQKQVSVAGNVIRDPGFDVQPGALVIAGGRQLQGSLDVYYLLNKPEGVLSATEDAHQRTVLDLIAPSDKRPNLAPVGRLDKDTTGLLLLTTDGALSHALLAPRRHVPKTYQAELKLPLTAAMKQQIETGIVFKDFTSGPAQVGPVGAKTVSITISEGKFHEVKRLFLAADNEVTALKRISMGPLDLPEDLKPGQYRRLSADALKQLQALH